MRNGKITYRLIIFALALIFGIIFSAPSFFQTKKDAKINLGLDLKGGLHMLLGVETEEAVHSKIKSIAASVNYSPYSHLPARDQAQVWAYLCFR